MIAQAVRRRLQAMLVPGGPPLDLVEAALLLAADDHPGLDPEPYLDQVADLTQLVAERNAGSEDPVYRLASLRRVVFEDAGFHGNREEFEDPRNSYLHEVIDRHLGIPVSLSILLLGIGQRLGWPLAGVNFPLHFLVRYGEAPPLYAVDAFYGGLILGEEELAERWSRAMRAPAPSVEEMLRPASPHAILARLLNNLKSVYARRQDYPRAIRIAEKMVLVDPEQPHHHRDLGYLYAFAKQVEPAVAELHRYLRLAPRAPDRDRVLRAIQEFSASGLRWDEEE
jgi:regulator of sirC expression with transglutaminase-like and TPR domain